MAVCNIFDKLTNTTGTFLTFSQYMEDLTMAKSSNGMCKVVPSKFIGIEVVNFQEKINNIDVFDYNFSIPILFRDYLENGCALNRNSGSYNPHDFIKSVFWDTIKNKLKIENNNIHYIGDINIQSYDVIDGMGYSEIYCHIPNDAKKMDISIDSSNNGIVYTLSETKKNTPLEGYSDENYILTQNCIYETTDYDISINKTKTDNQFNINLIIVLYDFISAEEKYENIPLGIYITGLINENGEIQNTITKYVSDESIYNAGTSYGLRICSRFVASANSDKLIVKSTDVADDNYPQITKLLSEMSASQSKMNEVVSNIANYDKNFKDTLAIFKNSQTNVPYVKNYKNKKYWFVNGKPVMEIDQASSSDAATATEDEVLNLW